MPRRHSRRIATVRDLAATLDVTATADTILASMSRAQWLVVDEIAAVNQIEALLVERMPKLRRAYHGDNRLLPPIPSPAHKATTATQG